MATINDLYEAFSTVNLREELPTLIEQTSPQIKALVIEQLESGKLATGQSVAPPYANKYFARKKELMNPLPGYGIPDVKYTGKLYEGIKATATPEEYDIESDVDYANEKNVLQYGPDLLALSDENKTAYCQETLLPVIQEYVSEKTGLTFD